MGVAFDPVALSGGANGLTSSADAILGHVSTVEGLNALREAFAGLPVWPEIEQRLIGIANQLKVAQEHVAQAGSVAGAAATGSAALDQNHAKRM
jgi:hypothetical protein